MSRSVTELLGRGNELVTLPREDRPVDITGESDTVIFNDKSINRDIVRLPGDKGTADITSSSDMSVKLPNDVGTADIKSSSEVAVELPKGHNTADIKSFSDKPVIRPSNDNTLARFKAYKDDPVAYMSLFGGLWTPDISKNEDLKNHEHKLLDLADKIGIGLPSMHDAGLIRMPAYLEYEDKRWLASTINALESTVKTLAGGRARPNYEMLFLTQSNGDLLNTAIKALTNDYFGKEFEKGRLPWQVPGVDLEKFYWSFYNIKNQRSRAADNDSVWSKVKDVVIDMVDDYLQKQDSNAAEILNGRAKMHEDDIQKYSYTSSPYDKLNTPKNNKDLVSEPSDTNLHSILDNLKSKGLLSGYHEFAGFEMGTNHNWRINIRPYNSTAANRESCVPPLPIYVLPDLWSKVDEYTSTIPSNEGFVDRLINKATDKIVNTCLDRVTFGHVINDMDSDSTIAEVLTEATRNAIYGTDEKSSAATSFGARYFSFADHTPVLSYDLNFGTIKTESQRLFNGSSVELFAGMQYNATMNIAILDDVYHSMYKYMIEYVNSIYDISTGSIAPYYSMAFEIELTILRSSNAINQHYKFIAVPIEFTPRLEGSEQPNECRVDITFGIIGIVPPNKSNKVYKSVGSKNELNRGQNDSEINTPNHEVKSELLWTEVMVNIGGNLIKT